MISSSQAITATTRNSNPLARCIVLIETWPRNHELADIRGAAVYATKQDGMTFHWLKSTSLKTHVGQTQWLVPAIALRAVQVLEGWSSRLRAQLDAQLARLRAQWAEGCEASRKPALLSEIRRIEENRERLFLGLTERQGHRIHALSGQGFNDALKRYGRRHGLSYVPTTHQFRRTYAVMMANGIKGIHIDRITLRDHFKALVSRHDDAVCRKSRAGC
jgi:hypothetical protein